MTAPLRRGRLRPPSDAPDAGEHHDELVAAGGAGVTIEQILSGHVDAPAEFVDPRDEWVAVLAGHAVLDIDGDRIDMAPGDWVLLPADVPHTLVDVEPGTTWLACHFPP